MHKFNRDARSPNPDRFGYQSDRSIRHNGDSLLHRPSHIDKRISPSPSRLNSDKTSVKSRHSNTPASQLFNPTVIA
jgi:hypothetical protein